jgi:hypothetical protein
MPYADITQQRAAQREWHNAEYHSNPTFRKRELKRKKEARAGWGRKRTIHNRTYMREYMQKYRAKLALKKKEKVARTLLSA